MLARLFALDHIAARLRRNGENLLVLSGGEPGRPATQAVGIGAVITAAASEIEDFQRVEVQPADLAITGPVVGDLVHLLAELLENATTFVPDATGPGRRRPTVDGAIFRVDDSGIGIAPRRLVGDQLRLATPTTLSSAAAGTMGLHVVSHLAARHRIRVELHATGSGTVAYVALPHRALERMSALPVGSGPHLPGPRLVGAGAVRAGVLGAGILRAGAVRDPARASAPVSSAPVSSAPISAVPVSASPGFGPPPVVVPSTVGAPLGRPRAPQQHQPTPSRPPAPWFRPYLSGGDTPAPPVPASPTPPAPGALAATAGGPVQRGGRPR